MRSTRETHLPWIWVPYRAHSRKRFGQSQDEAALRRTRVISSDQKRIESMDVANSAQRGERCCESRSSDSARSSRIDIAIWIGKQRLAATEFANQVGAAAIDLVP